MLFEQNVVEVCWNLNIPMIPLIEKKIPRKILML